MFFKNNFELLTAICYEICRQKVPGMQVRFTPLMQYLFPVARSDLSVIDTRGREIPAETITRGLTGAITILSHSAREQQCFLVVW